MSNVSALSLSPMSEDEFAVWYAETEVEYAAAIGPAKELNPEQALVQSRKELTELLPDGLTTKEHLLWTAHDADGAIVGDLWINARQPAPFIYNIRVSPGQRGKGYGRAIMLAAEEECRQLGFDALELNVFTDNPTAVRLYDSLGYDATEQHHDSLGALVGQRMRKKL